MATDSFICCGVKRWRETETLYLFTYFYFLTVSTYTVYWLSVNCRRYYPCPFPSYTGCYWSDTEGDYQYFFHPTFPIYYLLVVATNELGSTKTTFQQSTSDIGRASQRAYIADKFIMYTIINLFYTARLRLIHIWLVIVYFCALLFAYGYWYILVCFLFFFLSISSFFILSMLTIGFSGNPALLLLVLWIVAIVVFLSRINIWFFFFFLYCLYDVIISM